VVLIRYPDDQCPPGWKAPVLALGNFDGLHRGHMKIIDRVHRTAEERGATPVALTFDPHPTRVLRPEKAPRVLMTEAQKVEVLGAAGMRAWRLSVSRRTCRGGNRSSSCASSWWSGSGVGSVGRRELPVRARTFGHLRRAPEPWEQYGFRVEKIDPVCVRDAVVSSTRVRRLLADGRVDEASALLGATTTSTEKWSGGRAGPRTRVPDREPQDLQRDGAANGVYATIARTADGFQPAVTNVGVRPTFDGSGAVSIETHLLRGGRDLYGAQLRLYFVRRLRDEHAFVSADALRARIAEDCREARALFGQISV